MNFKKFLSIFLALTLVFTFGTILTSCGGDTECTDHVDNNTDGKCDTCGAEVETEGGDDGKSAYTVTVKDANNAPIAGAVVTIATRNYTSEQITTDADGKATASLKAVGYVKAKVISVPDGYVLPTAEVEFADNKTELTISVALDTRIAHTITLTDNAGNALSGVLVQICEGGVCQTPVATDANGKAVIRFVPSGAELKARVLSLPTGYAYPDGVDAEGYIHVAAGTTEITLTLVAQ